MKSFYVIEFNGGFKLVFIDSQKITNFQYYVCFAVHLEKSDFICNSLPRPVKANAYFSCNILVHWYL